MGKTLQKSSIALLLVVLLIGIFSMGILAANPETHNNIEMTFGDTGDPTPPESLMDFEFVSGDTYHAKYNGTDAAYFYPTRLALFIEPVGGTISGITATGVDFLEFDVDGTPSVMNPIVVNPNHFYAIEIHDTAGTHSITATRSGQDFTVTFDRPKSSFPALTAAIVNGYLPGVSQYASGMSYGSISTDNLNSLSDPAKVKTIGANAGTMVSLGSSGYIQYELDEPITDSNKHKWGVDFVVQGNPFNGNPEAGMVMVAEKVGGVPGTWYRLAGSRHYEADTVMNTDVTYTLGGSNIQVTYGGNTSTFGTNINWWPKYAAKPTGENYGHASGIGTAKITNVSYPSNDTTITYQDRTVVADDAVYSLSGAAATDFYAFGYADVRPGSGFTNPYATLPSSGGGADGFDLAWAVDKNGTPVDMSGKEIYFIQVYTAPVYNAGVFGETSTEVASFTAATKETNPVGLTAAPTVKFGRTIATLVNQTMTHKGVTPVSFSQGSSFYVQVDSAAGNIYVNNQKVTSGAQIQFTGITSGMTKYVRIITQNGDQEPYLTILKVTR